MNQRIEIGVADRVMTIMMNRPEQKNALDHQMYAGMADGLAEADAREDVRAIVISGRGDAFTSGNDIADFMQPFPDGEPPAWRFLSAILRAQKPMFCAVNGAAVGVGLTMLLHADFAFAAEEATFKVPFARLGLVPEAASSLLLPKVVGMAMANDILIAGRTLSARDALQSGLISRIYPSGDLLSETMKTAREVASLAPTAVARSKSLIRGDRDRIAARIQEEGELFAAQLQSPEFMESASAFLQKRAPNFD
ncbi:MAG: enoyl-CoA hydratase [Alphaproteobacteria bacterium]|nr:enoyl-CoA hydratase [Alphaproteobacteria bacterium]